MISLKKIILKSQISAFLFYYPSIYAPNPVMTTFEEDIRTFIDVKEFDRKFDSVER